MSQKILNTVRGSGANITERASKLTTRQCRENRQANRISYCINTRTTGLSESVCEVVKHRKRTVLWP